MRDDVLNTPIEFLKGVGPRRAELLQKELGIFKFEDLLYHYPFRYIDRSRIYKISEINDSLQHIQLLGRLRNIQKIGGRRIIRVTATLQDKSGSIDLIWFKGLKWILNSLKEGQVYLVFGKASRFKSSFNIVHPEMEEKSDSDNSTGPPLHPVYPSTDKLNNSGLGSRAVSKLVYKALNQVHQLIPETISGDVTSEFNLLPKKEALQQIHFPESNNQLSKAIFRIKFEELFFIQLRLLRQKLLNQHRFKGFIFEKIGPLFNEFYEKTLPFELTNAQKRVLKEIRKDLNSGSQMNRLLQGDVGSGKTIVAAMTALMAIDNNYQACVMAPTEILAVQHMNNIGSLLSDLNIKTHLLTGSTKQAERKGIHADLESGNCHLIIGTHALLEEKVAFKNLGLAIIDEQHRFGVAQRARLWKKNEQVPHVLVMTATPIPRTLAMTLYGDLDVSVIDELPPGRKAIETIHRKENSRLRVFGSIENEIKKGRQVYIVYPLIEESEKLDYKDLMDGFESITRRFPRPDYHVSIVHGKMKPADKEFEMNRFKKGETQILVATTVIEVGVDIPNASVMVIESAERFGLSQLHQLRGRVGRGAEQSYCILLSGHKLSEDGKTRLETMVKTNDGFEISEVDLKLRGPGDFHGTQQSGLPMELKLTNLSKDGQILGAARRAAQDILKVDPNLDKDDHVLVARTFHKLYARKMNWGRIS